VQPRPQPKPADKQPYVALVCRLNGLSSLYRVRKSAKIACSYLWYKRGMLKLCRLGVTNEIFVDPFFAPTSVKLRCEVLVYCGDASRMLTANIS